jgi:serine/threonine protein kinase
VANPERKRRFVQESKSASALNHPNIVTIYDIDSADGIDFIAMEYIPGKPLDEVIPKKGMRLN